MRHRNSQISMEFMLIFTLVLLLSMVFLSLLSARLSDAENKKDFALMQNLAHTIQNEILLASQVHDNYIRKFEIPYDINGKNYSMKLEKDELIINITGENGSTVYNVLPQEIKGGFLENNKLGFLDYCITKNRNEIRISRNQASLEYAAYDQGDFGFDTADYNYINALSGPLSVNRDGKFRIYLRVNCVINLQSIVFDLYYDGNKLQNVGALKQIDQEHIPISSPTTDILSEWLGDGHYYDSQCEDNSNCRHITIIKVGEGPLGSGIAAEFEFRAKNQIGKANIQIKNLELIDSSITPEQEGYIPPSVVDTSVEII